MKDYTLKYKSFLCIGDTHGNHNLIIQKIKSLRIENMTLFHVGDFGVGFAKTKNDDINKLFELNEALNSNNCHLYVIRGNHDNPYFFNGNYDYSNLHLMPDYSVVNVNGDNVLMVGGAISVDREFRKIEMLKYAKYGKHIESYWHDELFVLNEKKLKEIVGVSYVITHSSPNFTFPINDQNNGINSHGPFVEIFVSMGDEKLKDDLNKERNDITKMYDIIKEKNNIKYWLYGHFHTSKRELVNGTNFVLLNINEFYNVIQ